MPSRMPDRLPENMPDRMPEYMSERLPDRMECQNICQIECQIECQNICQIDCQIECRNICQIGCQNICQIECQNICEIDIYNICPDIHLDMSWWGSHKVIQCSVRFCLAQIFCNLSPLQWLSPGPSFLCFANRLVGCGPLLAIDWCEQRGFESDTRWRVRRGWFQHFARDTFPWLVPMAWCSQPKAMFRVARMNIISKPGCFAHFG